MTNLVAFVVGLAFALGLGLGGMTQPARVLAFLDVAGRWDPSLALVMAGAVAVYAIGFRVALRHGRPLLAPAFALPTRRDLDARLVIGATVFGIGWGLAGLCPGPAITSLGSGEPAASLFVAAMLTGIAAHRFAEAQSVNGGHLMRHPLTWTFLAALAVAAVAAAQPAPHMRHGSPPAAGGRTYDSKTVVTISGEVVRVERPPSPSGGGVHFVVRTGDGEIAVHLGPSWYVDRQDVKIAAGDRVEVRGSRVTVDGKPAIITAEVKKGDHALVLRDDAGIPKWGGRSSGRHGSAAGPTRYISS